MANVTTYQRQMLNQDNQSQAYLRQSALYVIVIYLTCYVFFIIIMEGLFILMQANDVNQ